ncbi:MAG: NAD-dependent epimerase/dehydratase family protein [Azospirillum sp.]|nr:NAD-dependent epimerase/dehydratase family protein [Azospirillum sp.]
MSELPGQPFPLNGRKVYVAGHRGMVGSALLRRLGTTGAQVLTAERREVDLRRQDQTERWLEAHRPEAVFAAAATVGGILANDTRPAEFLYDNLAIIANLIQACHRSGVRKVMVLGSSCMYPRLAAQPIAEDSVLTGPLEPTNQWYAVAKLAGLKLAQAYRRQYGCDFITAVPTNLFGVGDNFDPAASHVIPAMIRKVTDAQAGGRDTVEVWGTGSPEREFLYVDDAADAMVFLMERYSGEEPINIAGGQTVTIRRLAELVAAECGWRGRFVYDADKPDGMPRKALEASRLLGMGWRPEIGLQEGLRRTCAWFLQAGDARLGTAAAI